jgi:exodeoxyribonuclease-5
MTQTPPLSPEQASGIEEIKKWYQDAVDGLRGCFRLFGPAGTGKTTMAKAIPGALGTTARFMTYTGKAAHVLGRKGVEAKTIHSSIYYPVSNSEAKAKLEECWKEAERLELADQSAPEHSDPNRLKELRLEIQDLEGQARRLSWEWNPEAMSDMPGVLILDEVSMVNGKLAQDIEAYGIPVIVLGDPAQLPPVGGRRPLHQRAAGFRPWRPSTARRWNPRSWSWPPACGPPGMPRSGCAGATPSPPAWPRPWKPIKSSSGATSGGGR